MDLQSNLIESKKKKQKGGFQASVASLLVHSALIGTIIFVGASASHKVDAEEQPIRAFITQGAAPPPPPPPPAPASGSSAPKATPKPKIEAPKPDPVITPMTPPVEIPKEVPKVDPIPVVQNTPVEPVADPEPETPSGGGMTSGASDAGSVAGGVQGGVAGGVVGGVVGGVQGGTVGGEIGGTIGGEIGGVKGGVVGGVVGGKIGGTGTGTEGEGTGGPELPKGPVRVGGDVSAPTVTTRVEPEYTEPARAARVQGVVIVDAIIDRNGRVTEAKIIKGLPMGLGEQAVAAVRQWRFKPGRMNGQPVDVIFNLTVNFKMNNGN